MKANTIKTGLKGALIIGGLCALIPSVYGQGIGLKKFKEVTTRTDAKLKRGKVIYQRQCASCHGTTGKNDTEYAKKFPGMVEGGFVSGNYNRGGGLIQIYNIYSKPTEGVKHPVVSGYIRYQDRWALAHYVQSLSGKKAAKDPAEVIKQAKFEAVNGICREEYKASINKRVTPGGDEQMKLAIKEYKANACGNCHGENGQGNGPGASGLNPAPRNFTSATEKWTKGSSPLNIFNTLSNGIDGTSMAAYPQISEDGRWALAHYIRQKWVPKKAQQAVTQEDIMSVCRTLSTPPPPKPISVDQAMKFLVEDAPIQKKMKTNYGPIYKYPKTDLIKGQETYTNNCASCHGANGKGMASSKPYGAVPPFLYLKIDRLEPSAAGGTYQDFSKRSIGGVHATLPNMTGAALLSVDDWKNLQAYVANFEGKKEFVSLEKPKKKVRVKVTESKIEISEKVFFETGKAVIGQQSFGLLDDVAKVLVDNPNITLIQVEGHTDNQGDIAKNIKLSADRAKAIRDYLVGKGVKIERVRAKGFGASKPLVPNTTPDNQAKNRRVEFTILKQEKKVAPAPQPNTP